MTPTFAEGALARQLLASMERLVAAGGFFVRGSMGGSGGLRGSAFGCALGADWWMRLRGAPGLMTATPSIEVIGDHYAETMRVDPFFTEGVVEGFDWIGGATRHISARSRAYGCGFVTGLFLAQWVDLRRAWRALPANALPPF